MDQRNHTVDVAKGIGILLVIIGHTIPYLSYWGQFIYSFHMPLFFFLAGAYFRYDSPRVKFWSRIYNRMVIPYIVFGVVGFFAYVLRQAPWSLQDFIISYFYICHPVFNGNLWFLVALAGGMVLLRCVLPIIDRDRRNVRVILYCGIAFFIPRVLGLLHFEALPFQFGVWFKSSLFMCLGWWLRDVLKKEMSFCRDLSVVICAFVVLMVVIHIDLLYKIPFLRLAALIAPPVGVAMVLCMSNLLLRVPCVSCLCSYIGMNSLIYFGLDAVIRPCLAAGLNTIGFSFCIEPDRTLVLSDRAWQLIVMVAIEILVVTLLIHPIKSSMEYVRRKLFFPC